MMKMTTRATLAGPSGTCVRGCSDADGGRAEESTAPVTAIPRSRNLPEALISYQAGLAIRDRLAKSDPGNALWQRDLSVAYEKVGDVLRAEGDFAGALTSYRES